MKSKKLLCGLLCGAVIVGSMGAAVSAKSTDSCSGTAGNAGFAGSANISKRRAVATTVSSTGAGNGTVKVSCTNKYRDVSAGKTKSTKGSASGAVNAQKSFTVYEEDYMKSLDSTHSAKYGTATWSDTTSVTNTDY